ncbi:DUF2141 domain-containing protein [Brevundimonas sp. VNH65]|uniref:DUF2141 domain-containing protein n=1 Tax=Brevundimonas sp. VNH65 TaxID=3400917 RepID=UPI003C0FC6FE
MKTVPIFRAAVLALVLAGSGVAQASAQQTGGVPIPPPPRPGSPAAEAAARDMSTEAAETPASNGGAEARGPATPGAGATVLSPEAAAAVASATARPVGARTQQTSLLLEVEATRREPISVAIYRDADGFRRNEAPVRTLTLARDAEVSRAFVVNLPAGRYAIVAWQDADGDGKPTRARFGGVSEPHGYSRDARGRFGPPRFEEAAFDLTPGGVTQRIILRGGR